MNVICSGGLSELAKPYIYSGWIDLFFLFGNLQKQNILHICCSLPCLRNITHLLGCPAGVVGFYGTYRTNVVGSTSL